MHVLLLDANDRSVTGDPVSLPVSLASCLNTSENGEIICHCNYGSKTLAYPQIRIEKVRLGPLDEQALMSERHMIVI